MIHQIQEIDYDQLHGIPGMIVLGMTLNSSVVSWV